MPKLDATHILERLSQRLEKLEAGKEIAAKEIRSLLTTEQQQGLKDAWSEQERLRTQQRARTEQEKKQLGWMTKREVRIEVFKHAVKTARKNINADYEKLKIKSEVRQARIYFDGLNEAEKNGLDNQAAKNFANKKLTMAGLRRIDGKEVGYQSARDKEVFAMEAELRESFKKSMTANELEQLAMSELHDKAVIKAIKARK